MSSGGPEDVWLLPGLPEPACWCVLCGPVNREQQLQEKGRTRLGSGVDKEDIVSVG